MFTRLKNWLKKSGVKYSRTLHGRNGLIGSEIIDSLNPLDAVIEHPEYPIARIYRESFWTGIEDTFHVLMGNHYKLDSYRRSGGRKGILDILIFPLISRRLISFAYEEEHNALLRSLAGLIGYALEIPRGLLGILLTIALIPIVAVVHAITYSKAQAYREKIQQMEVIREKAAPPAPLRSWKKRKDENKQYPHKLQLQNALPNFQDGIIEPEISSNSETKIRQNSEQASLLAETDKKFEEVKETVIRFKIFALVDPVFKDYRDTNLYIEIKEKNQEGIKALLATNTAHILDKLKTKPGALQQVQEWIIKPPNKTAREAFCDGASKAARHQNTNVSRGLFRNPNYDR